jgi:hypothetical protein
MAGTVNPENIFDGVDDFEDEAPETGITTNPGFPLTNTNGALGDLWLNTTTGELYACTDITTDANIWTNIGDGTGNIIPNDPPGNPTNIVIGEQRTETSFNHTFTGGTDGDGQVTHYMVDEISGTLNGQVVNDPMTVALPEVPVGVPHQFTVAVLTGETLLSFRVRSKDNQGSYSTGETITFNGTIIPPVGEIIISNFGSNTWVAPSGVTSVSVVAVGGGGSAGKGDYYPYTGKNVGAGGGGLGWKNNITVVPGQSYTIVVGSGGVPGVSGYINGNGGNSTAFGVIAYGGSAGNPPNHTQGSGSGTYYHASGGGRSGADGGGNGGTASVLRAYSTNSYYAAGGGGGAGGYSGNGGKGIGGSGSYSGQGGGGVGIFGEGSNGLAGQGHNGSNWVNNGGSAYPDSIGSGGGGGGGAGSVHQYLIAPTGGSGGTAGGSSGGGSVSIVGGTYGGGGGGGKDNGSSGGPGVVRIIWGENRSFPSTNVDLASSTP